MRTTAENSARELSKKMTDAELLHSNKEWWNTSHRERKNWSTWKKRMSLANCMEAMDRGLKG